MEVGESKAWSRASELTCTPSVIKQSRTLEATLSDEQPDSSHAHSASRECVPALLHLLLSKDRPADHTLLKRSFHPDVTVRSDYYG